MKRLEAIALKLRLSSSDPKAVMAAEEFEARLAAHWRKDRMLLAGCLAFVFLLIGAVGWWLLRR